MTDAKYTFTSDMGEIFGFGGEYDVRCREMLIAAVTWMMDRQAEGRTLNFGFAKNQNVFDLTSYYTSDLAEAIDVAVSSGDGDAPGVMLHVLAEHLIYILKHDWPAYCAQLRAENKARRESSNGQIRGRYYRADSNGRKPKEFDPMNQTKNHMLLELQRAQKAMLASALPRTADEVRDIELTELSRFESLMVGPAPSKVVGDAMMPDTSNPVLDSVRWREWARHETFYALLKKYNWSDHDIELYCPKHCYAHGAVIELPRYLHVTINYSIAGYFDLDLLLPPFHPLCREFISIECGFAANDRLNRILKRLDSKFEVKAPNIFGFHIFGHVRVG